MEVKDRTQWNGPASVLRKESDKEVRVQQVIITTNQRRGDGVKTPIRAVLQVWSMDGELIAERDPHPDKD